MSWIVPALPRLHAALPRVTMHLFFGSGQEIVDRLRSGLVDCAVTSARVDDSRLLAERLHEERYAFVAAPELLDRLPLARPRTSHATSCSTSTPASLFNYFSGAPRPRPCPASAATAGSASAPPSRSRCSPARASRSCRST
ncbi:LysR substrate-binding domain-containing protein [Nannocystis pusilla]|uniref:LysR substrate-binding domain-containing protein n=1 Tax=Nannocystis pusilla TaxID=889268 RepID=UPI003B7F188B